MTFGPIIPPSVPYVGGYTGQPIILCNAAPEGPRGLQLSVDFFAQNSTCVYVNFQAGQVSNPISQIAALYVDNNSNPYPTEIYFSDTGFRFTVAAFSQSYVPVVAKALAFYVINGGGPGPQSPCNIWVLNTFIPGFSATEQYPGVIYTPRDGENGEAVPVAWAQTFQQTYYPVDTPVTFNITLSILKRLTVHLDKTMGTGDLTFTLTSNNNAISSIFTYKLLSTFNGTTMEMWDMKPIFDSDDLNVITSNLTVNINVVSANFSPNANFVVTYWVN